jgi:hypothetical protein
MTSPNTRAATRIDVPIRDALIRHGQTPFGARHLEVAAEMGCTPEWIRQQARLCVAAGILTVEGATNHPRSTRIYRYAPLPAGPTRRPVHDSPRLAGQERERGPGRGSMLTTRKDTARLIAAARAAGARVERGGSGHIKVVTDRGAVSLSSTPTDPVLLSTAATIPTFACSCRQTARDGKTHRCLVAQAEYDRDGYTASPCDVDIDIDKAVLAAVKPGASYENDGWEAVAGHRAILVIEG